MRMREGVLVRRQEVATDFGALASHRSDVHSRPGVVEALGLTLLADGHHEPPAHLSSLALKTGEVFVAHNLRPEHLASVSCESVNLDVPIVLEVRRLLRVLVEIPRGQGALEETA